MKKTICQKPKPFREPVGVTNEVLDFIDTQYITNDELTANKLKGLIFSKFNLTFSVEKIRRIRKRLGWYATGTKYCQLVREVNKVKRLEFATKNLGENFDNVLWSDESSIQLDWNGKLSFHRWWEPAKLKGKPKHPFKVNVWACISKRGGSKILIFTGIMDAQFYAEEIIKKTLKPFIDEWFADGHRFMQDNDPKHTSNLGKQTMAECGINWWPTPPESPDMNPIENIWHEIKERLRNDYKPRTKDELVAGIQDIWKSITPEKCRKYISHLDKVLPKVIEREGRASGY